ncbi:MAG: phosphodiester glycosidase family protein [Clostridiales bacterium]|nr:phosphodiester glycosidase family protein [Clostridiales bacterium]
MRRSRIYRKRSRARWIGPIIALLATALVIFMLWLVAAYSQAPLIAYWRGIYIETAMTTADHQWLATMFFPKSAIDEAMLSSVPRNEDIIGGAEYLETVADGETEIVTAVETFASPEEEPEETEPPVTERPETKAPETEPAVTKAPETEAPLPKAPDNKYRNAEGDILGLSYIRKGSKDYAGSAVSVVDKDEGLYIADVSGSGYKGKVLLVDDPSRVFVGRTIYAAEGTRIRKMASYYGAVAGINGSGFPDPDGTGDGRMPMGMAASQGSIWGTYANFFGSVIMTKSDKLVVGNISVWKNYAIRDGIQFGPILIADGEKRVKGSAGYGIQPRTAIGQRDDGVIVMLVIDGRDPAHSLGCTVGECAEILERYGCVNAACCDGGSSSVMEYGGAVINKNCSKNPDYGRRLPNAWLVKSKNG